MSPLLLSAPGWARVAAGPPRPHPC
ncbi:hypothetical protein [Curtobacterium sp. VKM Ac-1393]